MTRVSKNVDFILPCQVNQSRLVAWKMEQEHTNVAQLQVQAVATRGTAPPVVKFFKGDKASLKM